MSTVSSFGLTERELKETILPNIHKIRGLITTVENVSVLKPLECTLKEMDKLLWSKRRTRIVSQGNLLKFIQGVLQDEETRKQASSFCALVNLHKPDSDEPGLIPSLLKHYELLFIDVKRHQMLCTTDTQGRLQSIIPDLFPPHPRFTDYKWKQIALPASEDSSRLAQSFIGAEVLNWAHETYTCNGKWEQFLSQLHHLPILSSENTTKFITYINNKPDLDEQERQEKEERVNIVIDDGIANFRSFLSVRKKVELQMKKTCDQTEIIYIRKRYISRCIESFLQEANQTLQSHFPKDLEDTERKFGDFLSSLKELSKIAGKL